MTSWTTEAFGSALAVATGRKETRFPTPGVLAHHVDSRMKNTPMLDFLDQKLIEAFNTPDARLIISVAPQTGKSERSSRTFPLWCLLQNPELRVAVISYEYNVARRWGRAIMRDIKNTPDLNLRLRADLKAQHEWQLEGHLGGVITAGLRGGLTGRPVDILIIDDPVKDMADAESELKREAAWDWWTSVGSARLAPGAPVILIQTRWHEDDLAGKLIENPGDDDWVIFNIPAQADYDPEKGESDPLDREPGQYLQDVRGRTPKQWDAVKARVGPRTWNALYQGDPAPAEGGMFKEEWWQEWDSKPYFVRGDGSHVVTDAEDLLMSWDLAFKDTKSSDFVVGQVWMRRGLDCILLDQVRDRMDFVKTCAVIQAMAYKWPQAILKLVEDKANGPAVIAALHRTVPGIIPDMPRGSKEARASAVTPLVESRHIYIPPKAEFPWVGDFIHECKVFPNGAHDDQVDAMSQALNRIILQPLLSGTLITDEDFGPDPDEIRGWSISPV